MHLNCWKNMVAGIAALALLCGCASFKRNEPGASLGRIVVGSPRIEGRERLINDRRDQERWLQRRLEALETATFSVSGAVELNSLAVTAAQLGISLDPGFKLDAQNRDRTAAQTLQAGDDESALRSFRNSARDQIITRFNKGELTAEQAKAELEKIGLALPPAGASSAAQGVASAASVASRSVNSIALGDKSEKAAPPRNDPRRADLTSTPIEDFDDRLAARERIRNELNDIRLDDLHDLNGNTLYRLTFDTTVFPSFDDTSAWAVVKVKVPLKLVSDDRLQDLLERAEDQFLRGLRDTTEATFRSIANRLADSCYAVEAKTLASDPSVEASRDAFRRAFGCASFYIGSTTRRALERQLAAWPLSRKPEEVLKEPRQLSAAEWARRNLMIQLDGGKPDTGDAASLKLRRQVLPQWSQWLGEVFDLQLASDFDSHVLRCFDRLEVNQPAAASSSSAPSLSSEARTSSAKTRQDLSVVDGPFQLRLVRDEGSLSPGLLTRCGGGNASLGAVARFKMLLQRNTSASVYAVTPKESVQRLSEVASNRKVNELLLNLNAVTGNAGVAAGLQSLRANDGFYQALRRQPLVVGMTEVGRARLVDFDNKVHPNAKPTLAFGWILGPSFQISPDGKETRFRHSTAPKSVAAELSLPAWLDAVEVTVETSWVREDTTEVPSQDAGNLGTPKVPPPSYTLDLSAQPVEALAAIDERYLREPRIDAFQEIQVAEDQPANVMITGRNVWRSTDVFIGSQRSSSLTVLPDNRGVVARFDKVDPPHGAITVPTAGGDAIHLTLVTAEGRVTAGRVRVLPKEAKAKEATPKGVEGITTRIIAGVEQRIFLPAALGASDDPVVRVGSTQDIKLAVLLATTTQLDEDRRTLLFALPRTSVPNLKDGNPIRAELIVKKPSGAVEIVDIVKDGVFYESEDLAKATVSAKRAAAKKPIVLSVKLPRNSARAFKSLAAETLSMRVNVKLPDNSQESVETRCAIAKDACTVELRLPDKFASGLAALATVDGIKVGVVLSGNDVPALKESEVALQ